MQSKQNGGKGPGDALAHVERVQSGVGAFVLRGHDSEDAFRGKRVHSLPVHAEQVP